MATYDRLSAQDRSFLDLEGPTAHMHVGGVFIFDKGPLATPDGQLDIDKIRDYIESRLHRIPRYRQRIAHIPLENHPIWVDDDRFNIHYHVRHACLPGPGDDRRLKRLCGRVISQQLDRGKPLWEFWAVEGLEHDRFAMVTKVHHCMLDGLAAVDLMGVLLSPTPDKTFERGPGWYPNPVPTPQELVRDAVLRRFGMPFRLAGALGRALRDPTHAVGRLAESVLGLARNLPAAIFPAADTPLNRPIGPHRRVDWIGFDLEEIRQIKMKLGGTVNDVVLAIVAGAVGRYLELRGVSARKQKGLDFRVACPVSVRPTSEEGELGNRVSSMIASLPIAQRDPSKRLAAVREITSDLKESKQALGAEVLASISEWTAPTLVSLVASLAFRAHASNMIVTNVPGPQIPLYLLGARMLESYPMVPLFPDQGLEVALFSYAGGLFWGINSDWDHFPDLHEFVIAIDASFRELCEAADALEE